MRVVWFVAGLCWLVSPPSVSQAGAVDGFYDSDEASFFLSGSMRQIGIYTRGTDTQKFLTAVEADIAAGGTACLGVGKFEDCPAFDVIGKRNIGLGSTRLRVRGNATLRDGLSLVVVYDNEAAYGGLDTLEGQVGSELGSKSFLRAEGVLKSGTHYNWSHELYRGFLQLETERFEVSLGRQRVAWGVGRLWTPIDRFSASPPLSLQPEDTPGIDGVDARFNFDGFNYFQFVYAPGDSLGRARYAARLHGVVRDADVSLMGGLFEKAPTVGVDFARNVGDAAARFEAVFTSPNRTFTELGKLEAEPPPDFWQVVASFDINFDLGTGLYFLVEYLYNGNDLGFDPGQNLLGADLDRFASSRVVTLAAHQLGVQLGYDLTPELRFDFVTLVDANAGSAAFFPNLSYSPLDNIETTLGVQLFAGPERSQFGGSEHVVYLLADWFF